MKILFIGDVFADMGVRIVKACLPRLRGELGVDFCVANGENAASRGVGISRSAANALLAAGVDVITLGNHVWRHPDAQVLLAEGERRVIRPANYPPECPGAGAVAVASERGVVGVVSVVGRLYMDDTDCPFRAAEREVAKLKKEHGTRIVVLDIHAEATSEKIAIALCVDGGVSLAAGTHTHVQTADERILPGGTAFITDAGMTGPAEGVIGMEAGRVLKKFRMQMPTRFEPAEGRGQFNAVLAEVDEVSGRAVGVSRVLRVFEADAFARGVARGAGPC